MLMLSTEAKGDQLVVKPVLVYGDPPLALVERGELTLLGDTVPIRDRRIEDRLVRESGARLGLPVGLERAYTGESAVRFVTRARDENTPFQGEGWKRFLRTDAVDPSAQLRHVVLEPRTRTLLELQLCLHQLLVFAQTLHEHPQLRLGGLDRTKLGSGNASDVG